MYLEEVQLVNILILQFRMFDYVVGLAHNLLSIDQLCLIGYKVIFFNNEVHILLNDEILFRGTSLHNIYTISLGS